MDARIYPAADAARLAKEYYWRPMVLGPVHCVAFSPDGRYLAIGGQDRLIKIWDAKMITTPEGAAPVAPAK